MRLLLSILFLWGGILTAATQEPVQWHYTLELKGPKTYEVKAVATLQKGWHIYSMTTPEGGPVPTKFTFTKNPLITLKGTIQEQGNKKEKYEEVFGVNTAYFTHKAVFSQTLQLKTNVKTNISGTVTYMVCSEEQCLPPTTKTFQLTVQ